MSGSELSLEESQGSSLKYLRLAVESLLRLPIEVKKLANVQLKPWEGEAPCGFVDDVHLAGVRPRFEAVRRNFELKQRCSTIRRVDLGALDDRRLEHLHFPAIESEARLEARCAVLEHRIVDLIVEIQLLVVADDVGEVGDELDAVADQRARRLASSNALQLRSKHQRTDLHWSLLELGDHNPG